MSQVNALQLTGISKSFDGFKALIEADFTAHWGEVHALLGENGAGKSSLMNIAAGLYAPETGTLLVDDNPVQLSGPKDASRYRIGMVHQHFKLVKPFTVAQNILLALPEQPGEGSYRKRLRALEQEIVSKAAELGFVLEPTRIVDSLSVAEQQRVEILKVLLAGARILILDEPTAVLTDQEAERLLLTVQAFARQGAAVILVTHKMADVKRYADRVTVMRGGRTVQTLDPASVSVEQLVQLTVGESVSVAEHQPATPGDVRLQVRDLRSVAGSGMLNGVNMTLHAGQIYGIAGVGGNGQAELANALMGLPQPTEGEIHLTPFGDLRTASAGQRRQLRIASIPADRYGAALAGSLSVAENFAIGNIHSGQYGSFWRLGYQRLKQDAQRAVEAFDVQGVRSLDQKAALLSGGNAQKLVIAREFSRDPQLVLVHSPSRGLDVRATQAVHGRLRAARDAGAAVLVISEDLDEVLALADRIGVMNGGRIVAEFDHPADRQAIGKAMVSHD
ncbi:ABC transporter ATP-binding protein [Pseudomonas syringae]|uniref:ATP-binding cassette domain-containing protein n=1 Tax=Pseudomonas syringae TaxID=317 RepID=A0A9Q4A732_PSESX|nr:ABC transporter ATP-binding protein [Pseudomonas syringae]KTB86520.1 ABC transporter ATP-binding protein [Pseudomonas syringae pv. syringae PD2766]MCF5467302.1 ATP-binding cassette domain-containing protein [Pseudomonas syringae]MCF5473706.1 ATP-binding cassette domain-containing protein [Pseudomonas syringae]MCF5484422.1 ATP-binding cassette domain-containing protein [Pseudomonas syringae]MCF5488172.1 ATP-binding cassette domain-containing protein [Pseudomonas syringae]